ncbi:hypothetical protein P9112_011839 [Eukaryota sp. TZLM1-RC]
MEQRLRSSANSRSTLDFELASSAFGFPCVDPLVLSEYKFSRLTLHFSNKSLETKFRLHLWYNRIWHARVALVTAVLAILLLQTLIFIQQSSNFIILLLMCFEIASTTIIFLYITRIPLKYIIPFLFLCTFSFVTTWFHIFFGGISLLFPLLFLYLSGGLPWTSNLSYSLLFAFLGLVVIYHSKLAIDRVLVSTIFFVFVMTHIVLHRVVEFGIRHYWVQAREIDRLRKRASELICNIVPKKIFKQLKSSPHPIVHVFDNSIIIFAEVLGLPRLCPENSKTVLVTLNRIFSMFDDLSIYYKVPKLKTIQYTYMASSSSIEEIFTSNSNKSSSKHLNVLKFCLALVELTHNLPSFSSSPLSVRVGVARGSTAGGVIGFRRIVFDVWGDAVNTAARLMAIASPFDIVLCDSLYDDLVQDCSGFCWFESRQNVYLKGKGEVGAFTARVKKPAKWYFMERINTLPLFHLYSTQISLSPKYRTSKASFNDTRLNDMLFRRNSIHSFERGNVNSTSTFQIKNTLSRNISDSDLFSLPKITSFCSNGCLVKNRVDSTFGSCCSESFSEVPSVNVPSIEGDPKQGIINLCRKDSDCCDSLSSAVNNKIASLYITAPPSSSLLEGTCLSESLSETNFIPSFRNGSWRVDLCNVEGFDEINTYSELDDGSSDVEADDLSSISTKSLFQYLVSLIKGSSNGFFLRQSSSSSNPANLDLSDQLRYSTNVLLSSHVITFLILTIFMGSMLFQLYLLAAQFSITIRIITLGSTIVFPAVLFCYWLVISILALFHIGNYRSRNNVEIFTKQCSVVSCIILFGSVLFCMAADNDTSVKSFAIYYLFSISITVGTFHGSYSYLKYYVPYSCVLLTFGSLLDLFTSGLIPMTFKLPSFLDLVAFVTTLLGLVVGLISASMVSIKRQPTVIAHQLLISKQKNVRGLLMNLLPSHIYNKYKSSSVSHDLSKHFQPRYINATVIIIDIIEFTSFSTVHSAKEVVVMLNELFNLLDKCLSKRGSHVEKIRTLGDAYVACAGLDGSTVQQHAIDVALFALDIISTVKNFAYKDSIKVRIGIDYGPVLAGFVGSHRICFDLFGDVVDNVGKFQGAALPNHIVASQKFANVLRNCGVSVRFAFGQQFVVTGKLPVVYLRGFSCFSSSKPTASVCCSDCKCRTQVEDFCNLGSESAMFDSTDDSDCFSY